MRQSSQKSALKWNGDSHMGERVFVSPIFGSSATVEIGGNCNTIGYGNTSNAAQINLVPSAITTSSSINS